MSGVRRAFITGITGQDGSYLAELLLGKGYEVHGLIRRASTFNTARLDHVYQDGHDPDARLFLHHGDITDSVRLLTLLRDIEPDEVYNLAGQSHVRISFDQPQLTAETVGTGVVHLLEALRHSAIPCRFLQAGSAEMYGDAAVHAPGGALAPRSPYGAAKAYAHAMTRVYREGYGLFAANAVSYNHESPRRGETFVTRKITRAIARIQAGVQDHLYLGDLDAVRDWGYAPEYVEGMWRMLQADQPGDHVLATGTAHSVREFVETAFDHVGLDWERHVRFDDRYLRPTEADAVRADPRRAENSLGWRAEVHMAELARIMVDADVAAWEREGDHGIDRVRLDSWPVPPGLDPG